MKRLITVALVLAILITLAVPFGVSAETSRVDELMSSMTLRQKVTQMLMVDFRYWDEDTTDNVAQTGFTVMNDQVRRIIEDYDFGAIIYFAQNLTGTEQAYELTLDMQTAASEDGGIPMIISADQEGGSVYRLATGTALPGNMALGAAVDEVYAENAGKIIGSELSALGINATLAPVVDVNNNPNNPVIGLRSYGDNATAVGNLASAEIKGLKEFNVIGCAKHFPGHGDTATDSHYGLPIVDKSLSVLRECELKPYEIAIEQGIDMIMTAHILYPQLESDTVVSKKTGTAESLPATMSDDIITGLLKEDMGFSGIVVTDAMNMAGIADKWDQVQSVIIAVNAGVDMICMPCTLYNEDDLADLDAIINGVIDAVNNGTIPMSRINDAVKRILTVKENRGILDWSASGSSENIANAVVGSDVNRQSEREIAAASVTVVQNKNNTLPLNITSSSKVLMMCPYNNEQSQMLMGWNRAKTAGIIPDGAEVKVVRFSSASLSSVKSNIDWADTIIVNSEISSAARMNGKHWLSAAPLAFVDYAESKGKTTVVMSVDKPYDVQSYPDADAVLAVYGCKGSSVDVTEALVGGVTNSESAYGPNIIAGIEVAFGTFAAQGKLPLDIPKLSGSTYTSTVLYSRGTGITYNAKHAHTLRSVAACNYTETSYGVTADHYECTGCGMWFEDANAESYIADKYSILTTPSLHTHTYGEYSHDLTSHWQQCTDEACHDLNGSIKDLSAHKGGTATCIEMAVCTECGQQYGEYASHISSDWQCGIEDHWKYCSIEGCGEILEAAEAHEYGDDRYCDICGYKKTVTPPVDDPAPPTDEEYALGDVNRSGDIDMMDYILLKRNYFGTFGFDADQLKRGDCNKSGDIDMMDYILLKRAYFGTFSFGSATY